MEIQYSHRFSTLGNLNQTLKLFHLYLWVARLILSSQSFLTYRKWASIQMSSILWATVGYGWLVCGCQLVCINSSTHLNRSCTYKQAMTNWSLVWKTWSPSICRWFFHCVPLCLYLHNMFKAVTQYDQSIKTAHNNLEQIENQLTSHSWLRHFIKRVVWRVSHFPCKYATWKKTKYKLFFSLTQVTF